VEQEGEGSAGFTRRPPPLLCSALLRAPIGSGARRPETISDLRWNGADPRSVYALYYCYLMMKLDNLLLLLLNFQCSPARSGGVHSIFDSTLGEMVDPLFDDVGILADLLSIIGFRRTTFRHSA
jgi:hypothetical protein